MADSEVLQGTADLLGEHFFNMLYVETVTWAAGMGRKPDTVVDGCEFKVEEQGGGNGTEMRIKFMIFSALSLHYQKLNSHWEIVMP